MNKIVNYINLTNGLEWLGIVNDWKVVRIQSSLCESKAYDKLIKDLDYGFLLDLAQGYTVRVFDTSARKDMSRALYQGVPFIKYVLRKRWFGYKPRAYVRHQDVTDYFEKEYNKLSDDSKKKIDYVKKFLNTNDIDIEVYCRKSLFDGQYFTYREILERGANIC